MDDAQLVRVRARARHVERREEEIEQWVTRIRAAALPYCVQDPVADAIRRVLRIVMEAQNTWKGHG